MQTTKSMIKRKLCKRNFYMLLLEELDKNLNIKKSYKSMIKNKILKAARDKRHIVDSRKDKNYSRLLVIIYASKQTMEQHLAKRNYPGW